MTRKALGLLGLVFILCSSSALATTNSLLYTDNFEIYTNGTPLINNVSNKDWYASSAEVIVQTSVVAEGSTKAAMIPIDCTLSNRCGTNVATLATNVWLQMQTKIVRYNRDASPVYDTNSTAIFYINSNGYAVVRNGTSGWATLDTVMGNPEDPAQQIAETNFNKIDVFLDYTNKTWRLAVNSIVLTNNIGFVNQSATNMIGFDIYNAGLSTSYVDGVLMYDSAAMPVLSVTPSTIQPTVFQSEVPTNEIFDVSTRGDGRFGYYVITNDPTFNYDNWSATVLTNGTGSMTNNATNRVTVAFNTTNLLPGSYYNSFKVISTNWPYQTQTVEMVVNVRGMALSTNRFSNSRMIGYAAATQTFNVMQTGTGEINYLVSTNVNWMSVSPVSGTISNGPAGTNTITITYSTNGLVAGQTVTGLIEVGAGLVTQTVRSVMTTYPRPVPSVNFTNYSITIQKGQQPADTNLYVSNNCAAVTNTAGVPSRPRMYYTVTSDVSWLVVNTNNMTTNAESKLVNLRFASLTTNSGLYTGRLTLRGTDAGPSTSYTPTGNVNSSTQVTVRVLIYNPGTPTALSATKGTYADSVHLAWTAALSNVNHYAIWRGTNSDMSNSTRFETNATAVTYTDTGINPGIITYYWLQGINAYGGDSAFSTPDTGWRPLSAPTGISASDGTYTNQVALSWTAASGALSYEVWRSTINLTNTASLVNTVAGSQASYNDVSAVVETVYYYWIKSRTPYMGTLSDPDTGYRAALLQPQSVVASDGEFTNKVRVIWQAVEKASTYEVWRNSTSDRSSAVKVADSTASGYDDESATQGAYFYYWIRAANYEGYSQYSDPDAGWRLLTAPGGVAVTKGSYPYRIRVTWDPSQNASSYEVWRGEGTGIGAGIRSSPVKINQLTDTYYDDHAVVNSTPYYYKVKATGALGSSDYSASDYGWREIASATTIKAVKNDYDGDHLSDLTIYNPTSGVFQIVCSTLGQRAFTFGIANGEGARGDYDGDGTADPIVYWPNSGTWVVMLSAIGYTPLIAGAFGGGGIADRAVADFDGDTVTDLGVYDEAAGTLAVLLSNRGAFNAAVTVAIGGPGWITCSADFDGDAKADPAAYSATDGMLAAKLSTGGYADVVVPVGGAGITFHPADYDGDAKADLVTYEEASGSWIAKISSAGYVSIPISMGGAGYKPLIADYDGDAKTDPALYNETTGAWQIKFSASGYPTIEDSFGGTNYVPVGR